jgi:hypothetical protein
MGDTGERARRPDRRTESAPSRGSPTSGEPLDGATQAWFGSRLGHDLSRVRIHRGAEAADAAAELGARAYTVGYDSGADIVVGEQDFSPTSAEGRATLAHELAHVVQQAQAPGGTPASVPEAEAEADAAAGRLTSGQPVSIRVAAPAGVPLRQTPPTAGERVAETRARDMTRLSPGLGFGRDLPREEGFTPGATLSQADTETLLQSEIARWRPMIPPFWDVTAMSSFDSAFWRRSGLVIFRGREMETWEINYYFVSMAMAHQGYSWNEVILMITAWNATQAIPGVAGDPKLTADMWFVAKTAYNEELERMAQDRTGPTPVPSPPTPAPAVPATP